MQMMFERPINTIVGLGFLKPLRSVEEAYAFLMDWRGSANAEAAHRIALKTVRAALAGDIEPDVARGFVEAFARKSGLLAPEVHDVVAQAGVRGGQGSSAAY